MLSENVTDSKAVLVSWSGSNNRNLFSHCSGGWEPKIKVPVWSGSTEGSLPGLQTAAFSLYPHMVEGGRERNVSLLLLLVRPQSYWIRVPPL